MDLSGMGFCFIEFSNKALSLILLCVIGRSFLLFINSQQILNRVYMVNHLLFMNLTL